MSRTLYTILASILLVAASVNFSGAATRLTIDLNDLAKAAHAIAEVKVLSTEAGPVNSAGLPTTLVRVQTIKSYKGTILAGAEMQLEVLGGKQDGTTAVVPGQAEFEAGSHTIVLLSRINGTERWRVVAGDAGQILFNHDENGRRMARRGSGKFEFYVSNPSSVTGFAQANHVTLPRTQLEALLNAIVQSGRPVVHEAPSEITSTVVQVQTLAAVPASSADTLPWMLTVLFAITLVYVYGRRMVQRFS